MNEFWLFLAQTQAEEAESRGDTIIAWLFLGGYILVGLAFVIGSIWAFISRRRRERRQDKFEDRDN